MDGHLSCFQVGEYLKMKISVENIHLTLEFHLLCDRLIVCEYSMHCNV